MSCLFIFQFSSLCYLTHSFVLFLSTRIGGTFVLLPHAPRLAGRTIVDLVAPRDRPQRSTMEGAGQRRGDNHYKAIALKFRLLSIHLHIEAFEVKPPPGTTLATKTWVENHTGPRLTVIIRPVASLAQPIPTLIAWAK
jgi:hypothetical protein